MFQLKLSIVMLLPYETIRNQSVHKEIKLHTNFLLSVLGTDIMFTPRLIACYLQAETIVVVRQNLITNKVEYTKY